jgi:uncharacterized protein YraI
VKKILFSIASLALCAPILASAGEAFVVADIGLQAGPDTEYPLIEELSAGTTVTVEGCVAGWTWCDVVVSNGDRGWVPGTFLEETYGGQRVVLIDYGPRIGIPVVSFSLGVYWDRHYHSRPFYSQRQQWETRHISVRTPARPSAATTIARPTESRSQQQPRERTATNAPAQTAPAAAPAPTPDRKPIVQPAAPERTTRPEQRPETPPQPEVQPKETVPAPAKPTDMPPQMKPVEHPVRPEPQRPEQKPATAKPADEAKAKAREHEPKAKDELKAEKKKDDDGGGNR